MAIKFELSKFPVAFPAKVLSREGGAHMFSLQHTDDLWNGAVVAKGDYVSLDLYKATDATKINAKVVGQAANGNYYVEITKDSPASEALIVYNPPVIEEQYNKSFQLEANFYIPATMEARAYSVREGDIWELSEAAFSQKPTVGTSTITSISGKKWVVA